MVNSKLKIKKHKFSTRELREQHNLKKENNTPFRLSMMHCADICTVVKQLPSLLKVSMFQLVLLQHGKKMHQRSLTA